MKTVTHTWRDSQGVAITQQDAAISLANERAVPVSAIPGQVLSVH
jgi:hypothetical protein